MTSLFRLQRFPRLVLAAALATVTVVLLAATASPAAAETLVVDCRHTHQEIVGFGTCGMHWTGADLYGNPTIQKMFADDLGASMVRIGIPNDVIPEVDKPSDINYKNFVFKNKDARAGVDFVGKVYALNPKEIKVIGTAWSPPAWMKTNHNISKGKLMNKMIPFYAEYLAQWVLFMQNEEHAPVYAVSIQNELLFNEFYDSCTYTPDVYHATVLATANAFKAHHLNTKLFGPEHMTWDTNSDLNFVRPIVQDPNTRSAFVAAATHGYVDGVKSAGSAQQSAALWNALLPLHVAWWMTETSGTAPDFFGKGVQKNGQPNPGAFDLAEQIHNALTYGNASAWVYWCLSGHFAPNNGAATESLMNGETPTKKYFVSKQYYKFIRPGAVRVDAGPDGEDNLQISAYMHAKNHTITVVILNHATSDVKVNLDLKGGPLVRALQEYCTSETKDCEKIGDLNVNNGATSVTLPAQSVVTLFGTGR